jgi:hypothetical protein
MPVLSSGGFTRRSNKTENFIQAIQETILTPERYINIPTGIEYRFGEEADRIHDLLYRSMGPTTDLLRYFPDNLYLDRRHRWPAWEPSRTQPETMGKPLDESGEGLFSFFVEYKYSDSERRRPLGDIQTPYIGIIEREAWLTYKRLTQPNPEIGTYLDGQNSRIALFYTATYAPRKLYACWEHELEPIWEAPDAIRKEIARPSVRSVGYSTGSGTPWINFDIRHLKPLAKFLAEDLFWNAEEATRAVNACKNRLFGS